MDPEGPGERGDDHPRRSAIHQDLRGGGHVRADPARHRCGVPERDDQPHHHQQAVRRGLRRDAYQRPLPGRRSLRLQGWRLQRIRRGASHIRHQDLGLSARCEGQAAHCQEPRRPELRVHATEDLRLAVHARDGRANHRHSGRPDQADRRDDGEEPAGIHPLCARDDAAHDRCAGDPIVHDPAAAARQHRQARRRRQRAARRAQRAGRVRHGGALQLLPGLPQLADQCRADDLPLCAQERHRRQPLSGQHAQGVFRRRCHRRERLCLCLAAQAQRGQGLRHHADVRGRPRRKAEDALDRRPESRRHTTQSHVDVRGDGEARNVGRSGDLGDRDRGVLEASRGRSEVDRHRGDPVAGGVLHGKERHHQQLGRHGAMAPRVP